MRNPDSPCIGVCTTLYDEVCKGCGRTYLEVSNWNSMSQTEKDSVWSRIRTEGTAWAFTTYQERLNDKAGSSTK